MMRQSRSTALAPRRCRTFIYVDDTPYPKGLVYNPTVVDMLSSRSFTWSQLEVAMICFLGLAAAVAVASFGRPVFAGGFFNSIGLRSTHRATNTAQDQLGAVSSLSSVCSQIGVELLKAGGNAADATLGTQFCIGVIGLRICLRVSEPGLTCK